MLHNFAYKSQLGVIITTSIITCIGLYTVLIYFRLLHSSNLFARIYHLYWMRGEDSKLCVSFHIVQQL